jgi:phosphoglycerol transferase MdoB-like AlkP superfamily enzyme
MEYTPPLQYMIRQSFRRFISLTMLMTGLVILVRIYELVFVATKAGYPAGSALEMFYGLQFDFILSLRFSLFLLIPFMVIDHYSQKSARIFFTLFAVLLVVSEVVLLQYFSTTKIPLGSDILGYSMEEIKQTVGASGELSAATLIPLLMLLLLAFYAFYKYSDFKVISGIRTLMMLFLLFALLPSSRFNPDPATYKSEFVMNIAANKLNLFTGSILKYYTQNKNSGKFALNNEEPAQNDLAPDETDLSSLDRRLVDPKDSAGEKITSTFGTPEVSEPLPAVKQGNPFTYLSEEFPFLHHENTPDVLDPFFKKGDKAPSIVFIIVESLGRAYSGNDAYLGSYTPFLDSLMSKSLYWENCLSTSGRTFGVIPSLLASLPFGQKGFADLRNNMPNHLSLVSLLKNRAGYNSAFYYGGDPTFDAMEYFMKRQGTSKIVGINDFGKDYQQLPSNSNGFSWGYGDREIFRKYLSDLKLQEREKRVDVLLTLSMHNPFKVPNQAHYNELFEKRMAQINLSEEEKKNNRLYTAQFATMLYFDDALSYFFREFSRLKSFENTIFVITGDHRMPEIPISTQIDRFHVPLVIYSPLLTKGVKFSSLVTHYDVTPTLLSFLKNRLNLSLPTVTSWIGHGLDTYRSYRNLQNYPLMRNTSEMMDWIGEDNLLSGSTLYRIYPNMNIEPEMNPERTEQLRQQFANYKAKNNFATRGNHLIPDSLNRYNLP